MANDKNNLLLLFQKPREPLFTARDNGKTAFDVPANFFTDRYRPIGMNIPARFGETVTNKVALKPLATLPNLDFLSSLSRTGGFSLFNPTHKQFSGQLIKILMDQPDASTLLSAAAYIKDRVNVYLFQYALSVAVQHRRDTNNIITPSIVNLFPDQFIDPSAFPQAREEGASVTQENRQFIQIPLDFTASEKEIEQRMAYFREGIFQLLIF